MVGAVAPALLFALVLGLAGCLDGTDPPGEDVEPGEPGQPGLAEDPIRLTGTLVTLPGGRGHAVNVSAYNAGTEPYGYARKFFDSNYQYAWSASLSGPPGEDLEYAAPSQSNDSSTHANGAGYTRAPMPPGAYVNWTYGGPHERGECEVLPDCSNWWDGNLTLDGGRVRAPPGDYTWRFTFTYRVPESEDADWSTSRRQEHIEFQVRIPPGS
jgi:hypothetical protein